jgi:mono/diheme cytochrome c family protein
MLPQSSLRHDASFSLAAAIALVLIFVPSVRTLAQDSKSPNNSQQRTSNSTASDVARGKYLVENVAMCGECHTPRTSDGNLDHARWLQGAPIAWLSPTHDPNWPLSAPRIGGTPPANDADMIKLLTTGVWTTGNHLRLPMPQFRMDRADAEAVVAYLKSLTPKQ